MAKEKQAQVRTLTDAEIVKGIEAALAPFAEFGMRAGDAPTRGALEKALEFALGRETRLKRQAEQQKASEARKIEDKAFLNTLRSKLDGLNTQELRNIAKATHIESYGDIEALKARIYGWAERNIDANAQKANSGLRKRLHI